MIWFAEVTLLKTMGAFLGIGILLVGLAILFWGFPVVPWLLLLIGVPSLLLGLFVTGLVGVYLWFQSRNFKNGLLTAAIVESKSKRSLVHIAVLSNGGRPENYRYGILRTKHWKLPQSLQADGRPLACVSVFSDEVPHPGMWHSFSPMPVAFGTPNKVKQRRCLEVVGEAEEGHYDYFTLLRTFLSQNPLPDDFEDMYICDRMGRLLETRVLKAPAVATPPPLPGRS